MESTKLRTIFFTGNHPPEEPKMGDLWIENDGPLMCWDGEKAVELGYDYSSDLDYDYPPMTDKLEYPTHCPSCGAPVNSSRRKCDYCGVEYRKISYKN